MRSVRSLVSPTWTSPSSSTVTPSTVADRTSSTGTWTGAGAHSSYSQAVNDLNYYTGKGVARDRIVLGVPFYGYCWGNCPGGSSVYVLFKDIVARYPDAWNQDWIDSGGAKWSYNGVATMKAKTQLASGYGGNKNAAAVVRGEPATFSRDQYEGALLKRAEELADKQGVTREQALLDNLTTDDTMRELTNAYEVANAAEYGATLRKRYAGAAA